MPGSVKGCGHLCLGLTSPRLPPCWLQKGHSRWRVGSAGMWTPWRTGSSHYDDQLWSWGLSLSASPHRVLISKLKKRLVLRVGSEDSYLMWWIPISILPWGRQVDGDVSLSIHRCGIPRPPASLGSHPSGHHQQWKAGWPPPGSVPALPEAHGDRDGLPLVLWAWSGWTGTRQKPAGCRQLGGREAGEEGLLQGLGPPTGRGWSGRLCSWSALLPQLPGLNLSLTGFSFLTCRWPNSTVLEQSSPWVMGMLFQNPS